MNENLVTKFYRSLTPLLKPVQIVNGNGWPEIFGRCAPLELEIGFGNGEYLARSSQASPQRDFVGVEVSWSSLKRALRRLATPPRDNVRIVSFPAHPALKYFFTPQSLSMVRVLFPVPWPNDRQKNKRIFSTDFFNLLANRLTSDGGFFMVTDHHGLAQWTMDQALNSEMALTCQESPAILDTKYERKWLTFGQKAFYHLNGKKKNHKSAPQPASDDMTPRFSQLIDPNNYCPHDLTGEPSVVFGDFLYDSSRQVGLLRTKVVEDHFIQEFHIKVSRQPDGRFKVSPALKDQIFPTRGVSLALALAALEEPHP